VNWAAVWQYAVSGALVSWPVFLAGLWASHRKTREHVDQAVGSAVEQQNAWIRELTDAQTSELERRARQDRHQQGPEPYHRHGDAEHGSSG
jgi:hypothetical protein